MIEAIVGILYAQVKIAQYNRSLHAQHTYWIGKHFTQKKWKVLIEGFSHYESLMITLCKKSIYYFLIHCTDIHLEMNRCVESVTFASKQIRFARILWVKQLFFNFDCIFLELRYIMAWFHKSLSGIRVTEGVF